LYNCPKKQINPESILPAFCIVLPAQSQYKSLFHQPFLAILLYTTPELGWRQDNGNRSNQESKFDFVATRQCLGKIDEGQQKKSSAPTDNQIYGLPANQFSPSAGTTQPPNSILH